MWREIPDMWEGDTGHHVERDTGMWEEEIPGIIMLPGEGEREGDTGHHHVEERECRWQIENVWLIG
jgi:hypothetical protein